MPLPLLWSKVSQFASSLTDHDKEPPPPFEIVKVCVAGFVPTTALYVRLVLSKAMLGATDRFNVTPIVLLVTPVPDTVIVAVCVPAAKPLPLTLTVTVPVPLPLLWSKVSQFASSLTDHDKEPPPPFEIVKV